MLVPVEWLNDYTKMDKSTQEFADRMTMSGSNLEVINFYNKTMEKVVAGKIISIDRHPQADHLVVCKVDVGSGEPVTVITGAPNIVKGISEGLTVPVVLAGGTVPGPMHGQPDTGEPVHIESHEMRGIMSNAVMLSCTELGYDDKVAPYSSREGIWILPEDAGLKAGDDLEEALGLKQDVVDFEITPIRPDCLCMVGMARESAATFGEELHYPDTKIEHEDSEKSSDHISIEIKDPDLCPRYCARIIKDVKIGESPWWIQKRLMLGGMRPINNIVDLTNFVMLEYGQPMHAFDLRTIEDNKIVVERARNGEKFTTLDGQERTLDSTMLLIKDGKKGSAIAGVMGGLQSEIQNDTTTILVESATFNGENIRHTGKKLGLRTEAAIRFEKSLDPNQCRDAADRFCRLVEILGIGTVCEGAVDVYPNVKQPVKTDVRVSRVNKVLGTDIPRSDMESYLRSLEIEVEGEGDVMVCTSPTIRNDLSIEEDYVEEVGRMYGFDRIPMTLPKNSTPAETPKDRQMRNLARDTLCSMGFNEIQTYSFVDPAGPDKIRIPEDSWERNFVEIKNPLGDETSVMRTLLTPNMMDVLGRNYARSVESVRCYEVGKTFIPKETGEKDLPDEPYSICIGMYGDGADFFTLKGVVEALLEEFGIGNLTFEAETEYGVYHPGRCARIIAGEGSGNDAQTADRIREMSDKLQSKKAEDIDTEDIDMMSDMIRMMADSAMNQPCEIGIMGEVHPDVAANYGISGRVYICEIMFNLVQMMADTEVSYHPLPIYPSTSRDIAVVLDDDIAVGTIEKAIRKAGGKLLESVKLFDIYRGEQVDEGKKSAAFTLTYRDLNKTLTDEETNAVHEKVLEELEKDFNAVLREE
jgi:phenylalanyl-tRNA synthetase, beta subunit, non-spirochete bacterial